MLAAVAPGSGGQPVHQILGPAASLRHAPAAVDVMVEVRRVGSDMDVAAGAGGGASSLVVQDRADALKLGPGLGGVAEDRADHLARDGGVALHAPHPRLPV